VDQLSGAGRDQGRGTCPTWRISVLVKAPGYDRPVSNDGVS